MGESSLFIYYFIIITLIALTGTLSTVLNSSGERGHLCLVYDLKGKTIMIEYGISCGLFMYGFYYVEVVSLFSPVG